MRVRVTTEKVNVTVVSVDLSNQIKNSQCNECAASDERKCLADFVVHRDATPYYHGAQRGCEKGMTNAGKRGYRESFRAAPVLRPCRDYEWEPMSRNHGVQKTDRKSCSRQRQKDDVIHVLSHRTHLVVIGQNGKQLRRPPEVAATQLPAIVNGRLIRAQLFEPPNLFMALRSLPDDSGTTRK